ncbi:hypothetical protein [Pseudobacteriovorax antillogorgiicola]|uniref:Uncharacterized protein n=1 Tax=Pseudobacteriovorax antillogorgiicola TaxID=1513793 RepID=A0A1Y6CWQ3_9BACT|nr:hypothetical protein [Pseudobacteriovorax antillogorgiicola]TCS42744.1 hypothetical protein EDD56_14012 [Pseudobacteriovorax antillogorgiicola]SMF82219.1 hypothetical protein SAMN06296036_14012 [Pseudobacteriovorax antillogorgiicola]
MKKFLMCFIFIGSTAFAGHVTGGGWARQIEISEDDYLRTKLRLSVSDQESVDLLLKDRLGQVSDVYQVKTLDREIVTLDEKTLILEKK